jgi:hypothetical protein
VCCLRSRLMYSKNSKPRVGQVNVVCVLCLSEKSPQTAGDFT